MNGSWEDYSRVGEAGASAGEGAAEATETATPESGDDQQAAAGDDDVQPPGEPGDADDLDQGGGIPVGFVIGGAGLLILGVGLAIWFARRRAARRSG